MAIERAGFVVATRDAVVGRSDENVAAVVVRDGSGGSDVEDAGRSECCSRSSSGAMSVDGGAHVEAGESESSGACRGSGLCSASMSKDPLLESRIRPGSEPSKS